jgi:hypothetical protein
MELSMTAKATPLTPHDPRNSNPTATGAGLTTLDPGAGCTQVVNYAQWRSREAIAAARENPSVVARIREAGAIADSFTPVQDELRYSVLAAGMGA